MAFIFAFKNYESHSDERLDRLLLFNNEGEGVAAIGPSFNVSFKLAKRLLSNTQDGKSSAEVIACKKWADMFDTYWPSNLKEFCLKKPVCLEAPDEMVSVAYSAHTGRKVDQTVF